MTARERALRRASEASGQLSDDLRDARTEPGATTFSPAPPLPTPNLAAGCGSVIRLRRNGTLFVVVSVEWRGECWAVKAYPFTSRSHDKLSVTPMLKFLQPREVFKVEGQWQGDLEPCATGSLIPSETASTVPVSSKPASLEEATMATVTRKARTRKGTAVKSNKTAAPAPAPEAVEESATTKRGRKSTIDYDDNVQSYVKHLSGGGKMKALKEQLDVSSDVGIVQALYRAGYNSKGQAHGIEEGSKSGLTTAKLRDFLVAERSNGTAWYALAYQTGKPESELRKIVEEAGGSTARQYRERAESPATKTTKSNGQGKKVTRSKRAAKADPSKQA